MQITSGISAAALLALMLGGNCSRAQEPIAPATAAPAPAVTPSETPETPDTPDTQAAEAPVPSHSKIRIVRLSEVRGEVQIDRQAGKGFEPAMTNLPVVEGEKLKTGMGVAEIEFEDNSTVRVGANSTVAFPRLELLPTGAKASTVTVLQGTVYVSLINTKGNQFTVDAGKQTINLPPDTHVRLELTGAQANLAVMHGEAEVEQGSSTTTVGKNKTMTFSLAGQGDSVIAKNVTEGPLDAWDKNAVQYHKNFANVSSFGNSPYSYGLSDLSYYGSFSSAGGCGSMWRPYFASASWDPYGSGAFAYYPTAGYSWVSPYPWGWTPYHYGSWAYCQGVGWGWQPGGSWMGLNNYVYANNRLTNSGTFTRPKPPSHPPVLTQSTLVPVNMKAIPKSTIKNDTFVFHQDSAGFGVPRSSLGKLGGFSHATQQHGVASTAVFSGGGPERGSERGSALAGPHGSYSGIPSGSTSTASSHSYSGGAHSGMSSGLSSGGGGGGSHSGGGGGGASAGGGSHR